MRTTVQPKKRAATCARTHKIAREPDEIALLAEFMRHDSVASLADAIADRLGGKVSDKDLIASANLGSTSAKG
jgi:hypothetical protein